jgi:glycosyltransferase involved in cell wall biosynthesis
VVYDYEFWAGGDDATRRKIEQALRSNDIRHIAGSTAVRRMLDDIGVPVVATVPPGIDTDRFYCRTPPSDRPPTVGFAYRIQAYKGMADLMPALAQVHEQWPDVVIRCFGKTDGGVMPSWVESLGYIDDDELRNFYNWCAIFVLPSHYEGWGLPAAEAMACGAAVVTTNSGGTADFAVHERNALVVEPRCSDALSLAIIRLLEDPNLRYRLATAASGAATEMTWEATASATRAILKSAVAGNL